MDNLAINTKLGHYFEHWNLKTENTNDGFMLFFYFSETPEHTPFKNKC